jgi:outer membrane protein OmpA-like peptidoglycan-associated protein
MTRRGTCSNYAGCLLAYRNETIRVSGEEMICPECKQPLTPVEDAPRSRGLSPLVLVAGALVLIAIVAIVMSLFFSASRLKRTETAPAAEPSEEPAAAASHTVPLPANQAPLLPGAGVDALGVPPLPSAVPPPVAPPEFSTAQPEAVKPDLDLEKEENRTVKAEVLKRIDLMPTISADNKDKLYVSVERARRMGKIISIPFGSGRTTLAPADIEALRRETQEPELQQLVQDPTAVFVILGFADTKGDEKVNIRISQERADAVLKALRERCGIINVMHGVAMGGSTLFDSTGAEKNRIAEVWAVLP